MHTEVYDFKVGPFQCLAVSDGTFTYSAPMFPPPASFLFANAEEARLDQMLREHRIERKSWTKWTSPYICLLVNTGEYRVLIDTGADGLGPQTGRLLQNLHSRGMAPEDIDVVILTHGHPDHIGGITREDGSLAFPNAHYAMWKDEWDFWTSRQAEDRLDEHSRDLLLGVARKNLLPIQGQIDLIDHERDIVPGIRAVAAGGHTPGHMALAVSSAGELLLCISDTVLHPIHVERPEWCALVDLVPDQMVATRRRILSQAAVDGALVMAFHFPFPGLGHISRKGEGWKWQPLETRK
jgi:glyoxylase-like metal-dependent hydrolase (beta-lactamase superfamily II)